MKAEEEQNTNTAEDCESTHKADAKPTPNSRSSYSIPGYCMRGGQSSFDLHMLMDVKNVDTLIH